MEFYATKPMSDDELRPIAIYGHEFPVVNGSVTIPTRRGDVVITLNTSGKRKDWYYDIYRGSAHFIMVAYTHMVQALERLIQEEELLDA